MNMRKRIPMLLVALCLAVSAVVAVKTMGQQEPNSGDRTAVEQWEYLAVAGPGTTNLTPTGNPRMRKEPNVPFGREGFVLQTHLDKLGANGWELIEVAGPPTDPVYYFKRRKQT